MNEALKNKKVHVIGIGGTGMSPIATVLLEMGVEVRGSDRKASEYSDRLAQRGVKIFVPQDAANVGDADLVIYSSAVKPENPELAETIARGIPTAKRKDFLRTMLQGRDIIAIAGTHGKTTTTSMMAWTLKYLGCEPGFIIGSVSGNLGTNASAGKGLPFVIEADEYDRMFLGLDPKIAVLTRVEYDHPDCFPTQENYFDAFRDFMKNVREDGMILLNGDDENQRQFAQEFAGKIRTYGFGDSCDFRAKNAAVRPNGCYGFTFVCGGKETEVKLAMPGMHNVSNACAVLAVCSLMGLDLSMAADALSQFYGIGRRFEIVDEWNGITLIDDYAHHPTEIRATLAAARDRFPGRRIWAIWQPHTYSRTKELLDEFVLSFGDADEVIVTDIFAARETKTDFGIENVMAALKHAHSHCSMNNEETAALLIRELRPGDVVVTLSAGDANLAAPMALTELKNAAA